jgi:N-acetylglucosamine-6-sulfatase
MNFLRLTRFSGALRYVKRAGLFLLFTALILVPVKPAAFAPSTASATTPPNVVVIMVDDLDVRSLQQMLHWGLMPNLQNHVIGGGSTFTNAFVTNSVCCPSRATFLSGQYSHNHRVRAPGRATQQFDESSTLATWLQGAGYRTSFVGKYFNDYHIQRPYIPLGWDDWQVLVAPFIYPMYRYVLNDNGTLVYHSDTPGNYQTDVLAQRAARFIRAAAGSGNQSPFFLTVMPGAIHMESPPPVDGDYSSYWRQNIRPAPRHLGSISQSLARQLSYNESDILDKPTWLQAIPMMTPEDEANNEMKIRGRLEALRAVDDLIGTVVTVLQRNRQLANTILIVTSDNGFLLGEHRLSGKETIYEEAIRVPLYIKDYRQPRQQIIDRVALNNDLAPTIAEYAGVTPARQVDGRSLVPLIENPQVRPWRQRFLIEHTAISSGIFSIPSYEAVRTTPAAQVLPDQVYVQYADAGASREFYDLTSDPFQLASLHNDPARHRRLQMAHHQHWLTALRTCGNGSCQQVEFATSK